MLSHDQILRYSRQLILKDIGYEGQEKLLKSKVLVIGAGGLGSPVLYYLASCGIGTLGIADFDTVGISNLQRQILHYTDDIGRKKTDSAEEKLLKTNLILL
jgi:adenylyltransferase/sulfurtransferase